MATTLANVEIKSSNLADKTVLLHFAVGTIGNTRKVSNADVDISAEEMVNVNKKLLDSPELESIRAYDGEFRRWIDSICLPYEEKGIRILSLAAVDMVEKRIREFLSNRAEMVDKFLSLYSLRMREAQTRLSAVQVGNTVRNLYRASDYLSETEAREKFYVDWHYRSLSDTPVSLAGISPELFETEREKAQERMNSAAGEITAVMRSTLADLVTHLRDKLAPSPDGKQKVLRETAVTNVTEFLQTFDLRNVTNDAELAALAEKCRSILRGRSADMFRESENLRRSVAGDLAEIKTSLDALVSEKPSRKFKFED